MKKIILVKSILLPTDFSKNSMNAIDYAMELYKDIPCEFYIINIQKASSFVSDDLMMMSSTATIYQTLIAAAKKSIKNIIHNIESKYANKLHSFHSIVDYDNFIDGINQICEIKAIDLIIMGTKGAAGAEKMLFGSNTVHVMQRCNVNVLAIPNGCQFEGLDAVAFTSNYSSIFKDEELLTLVDIIKLYDSELNVLHLSDEDYLSESHNQITKLLDSSFGKIKHQFIDIDGKEVFKAIHDYIETNNIKMLTMMNRKHSFLERLFTKHLFETFGFKIDIPFLVMKNTQKTSEN